MKKFILSLMAVATLALTGCNRQFVDTTYNFKRVHIFDTGECYKISSWRDYEDSDQIQVKLSSGQTVLLGSAVHFALIDSDTCPFCK